MSSNLIGRKAETQRNRKTILSTLALFLILAMSVPLAALPVADAHTPPYVYATYPKIHVAPALVGVNENVEIVGLMDWALPGADYLNTIRFKNIKITITKPDNTTYVKKWAYAPDSGGSVFFLYKPDQVGVYNVLFENDKTVYTWTPADTPGAVAASQNDTWLAGNATTTFTVQKDPVSNPLVVPLPTEYWTRPIEGQNFLWNNVASNWLNVGVDDRWQKDGSAPKTPHIMWTRVNEFGGMVGGETIPDATFYSGFSYETRFGGPIVISGILYYQQALGHAGSGGGYVAVDLRTGEEIWRRDDISPNKAQLFDFQSPNQHGTVGGILYDSQWRAYDALTGKGIFNLTGVPNGFEIYDTRERVDIVAEATTSMPVTRSGDIIRYVLNYNVTKHTGWLGVWSLAKAVGVVSPLYGAEGWRPNGQSINASAAYLYNMTTLPDLNGNQAPTIIGIIPGDIIIGRSSDVSLTSLPRATPPNPWTMWAISDKPENRGTLLWIRNYTTLEGNLTIMLGHQPLDPVNRVWLMTEFETGRRYGYSIDNGDLLWGPIGEQRGIQFYSDRSGFPAYGILYLGGYGGEIFAYSTLNGTLLWKFNGTSTTEYGTGIPWGLQPLHISAVADGVVYAFAGEHSPNTPLYKGNRNFAIDAFTGEVIWSMFGWSASGLGTSLAPIAIADGFLVYSNAYDGQIYSIGKGPSTTTVTVAPKISVQGSSVLIEGKVTDTAAGTKQKEQAARFPDGVPAVSDVSMSEWMKYVYMQFANPGNATGVPVSLVAISSSGQVTDIGQVTSDSLGLYAINWKVPDAQDVYKIYANFGGTNSYFGSEAETALTVVAANPSPASANDVANAVVSQLPTPIPVAPVPTAPSASDVANQVISQMPVEDNTLMYIVVAAVVVAILIGTVNLVLLLRRKQT